MDTYIPIPTKREKREAFYGPLFKANHLHIHRASNNHVNNLVTVVLSVNPSRKKSIINRISDLFLILNVFRPF